MYNYGYYMDIYLIIGKKCIIIDKCIIKIKWSKSFCDQKKITCALVLSLFEGYGVSKLIL